MLDVVAYQTGSLLDYQAISLLDFDRLGHGKIFVWFAKSLIDTIFVCDLEARCLQKKKKIYQDKCN